MANMSYCRFENTYNDLRDCMEAMGNSLSGSEKKYRALLIDACKVIAESSSDIEDDDEDEEDDDE